MKNFSQGVRKIKVYAIDKDDIHAALRMLTYPNELVVRVMLQTGLRVGDVLSLRRSDIEQQSKVIKEQKTGKKRRLRLSSNFRQELLRHSGRVFIFEGRDDWRKCRTRQAVWKDLKRASELLRISYNLGTHSARKRWAVDLYESGKPVHEIQKIMNHSSPEVTMLYCLAEKIHDRKVQKK